ncbi:unnamed protein product [Brassicogethes aeneus]|uniref:Uncharacterized protein n=1 Tax=Brassicogethes aeneus TaxID=1431903 RepID=A0A9P0FHV3_BRAAE|nr:unnamed protein product [Brassicogethes aeneus]
MAHNLKITVVGDGIVGKTCMLVVYTTGKFPEEYIPTIFEHTGCDIEVDNSTYHATLWDTAGQEDYERLRPLSYPNTNCFLICFSVDQSQASYENVHLKWAPEVKHHLPNAKVLLVATKTDLRRDPAKNCYSTEDGKRLKKKIKAVKYMECSAMDQVGLKEIFEEAVRISMSQNGNGKKKAPNNCVLL